MASSYNSIEQLALYRLDFYKTKKDWTFYENMKEEPLPSLKNCNVNKTYNIGQDFSKLEYNEFISPHNKTSLYVEPATHLELKPAEDPLDLYLEYQTPVQKRQTAENWLTLHGVPLKQEEYADLFDECELVDESADFVRGAHTAPHSSEVELNIAQECPCSSKNSLCVLSMRQLARAIQHHHVALTLLLREQALRKTLSSRSLLQHPIPFDSNPTRDSDRLRPTDCVLSSAYELSASRHDAGTGRKRRSSLLQQHSVIGIGGGRPYRL